MEVNVGKRVAHFSGSIDGSMEPVFVAAIESQGRKALEETNACGITQDSNCGCGCGHDCGGYSSASKCGLRSALAWWRLAWRPRRLWLGRVRLRRWDWPRA